MAGMVWVVGGELGSGMGVGKMVGRWMNDGGGGEGGWMGVQKISGDGESWLEVVDGVASWFRERMRFKSGCKISRRGRSTNDLKRVYSHTMFCLSPRSEI